MKSCIFYVSHACWSKEKQTKDPQGPNQFTNQKSFLRFNLQRSSPQRVRDDRPLGAFLPNNFNLSTHRTSAPCHSQSPRGSHAAPWPRCTRSRASSSRASRCCGQRASRSRFSPHPACVMSPTHASYPQSSSAAAPPPPAQNNASFLSRTSTGRRRMARP